MVTFAKEALVNIWVRLLGSHEGPERSGLIADFCSCRVVIKRQLSFSVVRNTLEVQQWKLLVMHSVILTCFQYLF